MAMASPALAQDAGQEAQLDEVVVTGSRIPQANLVTTSPVTQVTGEDIDVAGVTRVEDLVSQLPQAFAAQNSTVSNGATGTATVSLRNLGASRTLVLIDGRRMGYGSPTAVAADLNQIPEQLVERVEVLTGGASAVYGSDAIAGVVNFIMKKDFEGIQIDSQYGFYQHTNDYDGVGNLRAEIARRAALNPSEYALPEDDVMDGESRSFNIVMGVGSGDGKGHLTAYAGYRSNNPILQRDRDYSACAIGNPAGSAPNTYTCGGSPTSAGGYFRDDGVNNNGNAGPDNEDGTDDDVPDTNPLPSFDFTRGAGGSFVDFDPDLNFFNFAPLNYYQRPDERYTFGAMGDYQVNDKVEAFAQLMFSDYRSIAQIAPSGVFGQVNTINCDNPLLSAAQAAAIGCGALAQQAFEEGFIDDPNIVPFTIGRRNVEGGPRQSDLRYTSYRGTVGLRGEIMTGWNYDVAAQFSRVTTTQISRNDFSVTRLKRALDVISVGGVATCRSAATVAQGGTGLDPACVPYNIFTPGGVTQAALDYMQVPLILTGETTQQIVTAAVTGDTGFSLPTTSRTLQVAFGAEYRRDFLSLEPDTNFSTNDGAGLGGPTIAVAGDTDVAEVFAEFQLPLADDQSWAYSASIDGAYRRSEYAKFGADTWKVGADYAPVEDIRFRASYSRAVRAPDVLELFTAQGPALFGMDFDPCSLPGREEPVPAACIGTNPWQVSLGQSQSGNLDNSAGQYNFLAGGNPDLNPEEADTVTLGAVWTPSFLPRFNLSIDYFSVKIDGAIQTIGAQNTLDLCYNANDAAACSRIKRNASTGSLWGPNGGLIEDLNINIGGFETSGVDFNANYGVDLEDWGVNGAGSLRFSFVGTLLNELITDTGAGQANSVYDCTGFYGNQCGTPNPEWRHRARLTWSTPWNIDVSGTWRHFSEVEFAVLKADGSLNNGVRGDGSDRLDRYFDAKNYLDLAATWQVRDTVTLRAGVNNVLDSDPPLTPSAGNAGNGNTFPQVYDAMGRFVFFGVTANF
ncbi:TonB-dependent receptor [Brevundimonas kwangchunensis]|uniref:TonB-dependent receptor n=2 Tax=Brevundimonas kwangchunensis TaxID=322163 RepID=A0ABP3S6M8_9CAUL